MIRSCLFLCFLLILSPVMAQQTIYSWRDQDGNIQYSDRFPTHISPDKVQTHQPGFISTPSDEEPTASPKTTAELEMEYRQRRAAQQEAEARERQEQNAAKQRKETCENARTSLRTLESGRRVSVTDNKGERLVIDDEMRAAQIEQIKRTIAEACN